MRLNHPISASYVYEICEPGDPPERGDVFMDEQGKHWTVQAVTAARPHVMSNPPSPEFPEYRITIEPKSASTRIEPGEYLMPVTGTRRSGPAWKGLLRRDNDWFFGFGVVTRARPEGDEDSGPEKFSWYYRAFNGKWTLKVGPKVEQTAYFQGGLYEQSGDVDPVDAYMEAGWGRIAEALTTFLSGA